MALIPSPGIYHRYNYDARHPGPGTGIYKHILNNRTSRNHREGTGYATVPIHDSYAPRSPPAGCPGGFFPLAPPAAFQYRNQAP